MTDVSYENVRLAWISMSGQSFACACTILTVSSSSLPPLPNFSNRHDGNILLKNLENMSFRALSWGVASVQVFMNINPAVF